MQINTKRVRTDAARSFTENWLIYKASNTRNHKITPSKFPSHCPVQMNDANLFSAARVIDKALVLFTAMKLLSSLLPPPIGCPGLKIQQILLSLRRRKKAAGYL